MFEMPACETLLTERIGEHVLLYKAGKVCRNFKVPIAQLAGIVQPLGVLAHCVDGAFLLDGEIVHIAPEWNKGFAHLKAVGTFVGNLADGGKGLVFLCLAHAQCWAVIQQPVAFFHAI